MVMDFEGKSTTFNDKLNQSAVQEKSDHGVSKLTDV
jgi:hypothetical protein